jgi:uncharacterized protein (DUF433 family)
MSAVAYSMLSQVPNVAGGRPSIRKQRMRRAVVTKGPSLHGSCYTTQKT